MDAELLKATLEELQLIRCSLLLDENLSFADDAEQWMKALATFEEDSTVQSPTLDGLPTLVVRVQDVKVWFEVTFSSSSGPTVSVKGENLSRADQEKWQATVKEAMEEIGDTEFPAYQLVSLHLFPRLREELEALADAGPPLPTASKPVQDTLHVLFTSHHLISPTKRRSLQHWSSSLPVFGFAKLGYPGVIYAQGERSNIEEFVSNVKSMQWLALKVRFMELIPPIDGISTGNDLGSESKWKEFQKVGEVVEEMRRLGRGSYVVEMGIGSTHAN